MSDEINAPARTLNSVPGDPETGITTHRDDIRVRFGPGPTQTMPLTWAEQMLDRFRDQYPAPFAKLMGEVALQGHTAPRRLRNPGGSHEG